MLKLIFFRRKYGYILMRPFRHLSNQELTNLFLVSKMSSYPALIDNADSLMRLSSRIIGLKAVSFYMGNTVGRVFSAGETISDLKSTLLKLSEMNQGSVIDYCAEGETSESEMDLIVEEIGRAIKSSSGMPNTGIAVKITALIRDETLKKANKIQEKLANSPKDLWKNSIFMNHSSESLQKLGFETNEITEIQNCMTRARKLCGLCKDYGLQIMIDAEQTFYQSAIDSLAGALQLEFNQSQGIVLNTIQSYLANSTEKLRSYYQWSAENNLKTGIKLVRGAYMKQENAIAAKNNSFSPINPSKEVTDSCYNNNLALAIHSHTWKSSLCVATHNDLSIEIAKEIISEKRLHRLKCGISFAQLLGMKTTTSFSLSHDNYIVQKYVPYGPYEKMIPYLIRRAHEQSGMISEVQYQVDQVIEELQMRVENESL